REHERPARHRARVVVPALDLVERIASAAFVARTNGADELEALVDHPFVDHVRRDLILDAGPHLVAVDERQLGSTIARPRAQQQTRFVLQCESPLYAVGLADALPKVVRVYRAQRRARLRFVEHAAEPARVRFPLADQLIRQAARAVDTSA